MGEIRPFLDPRVGGRGRPVYPPPPPPPEFYTTYGGGGGSGGDGNDFERYLRILRTHRKLIVAIFAAVVAGVAAVTMLLTPIYRASGLLEIREEGAAALPTEMLFKSDEIPEDYLETQYGLLRSAALSERVIRGLELHRLPAFNPALDTLWGPSDSLSVAVVVRFQDRLHINPVKGSRLVRVSFEAEDPELTARVVNAVLSNYVEMRVDAAKSAAVWLTRQLDSTRRKLATAERALLDYLRANGLVLLDAAGGDVENLLHEQIRQTQTELSRAEADRMEKEAMYRTVVQGRDYSTVDNDVIRNLTIQLAELKRQHANLAATFTEQYPGTRRVKQEIDQVEALLRQERQRVAAQITSDYRAAMDREALVRQSLVAKQELADQLAEKSAPYYILKRDVDDTREAYAALQKKLNEVNVAAAVKGTNVGIVDLAKTPRRPYRPNLTYNLALAMVAGLMLGVGAAVVRDQVRRTVYTVEEVDSLVSVPVVAMIPSVRSSPASWLAARARNGKWWWPGGSAGGAGGPWPRLDRLRGTRQLAIADAFGNLRATLLGYGGGPPLRSLIITSCQPRDGKTTVSVNLAMSLARMGRRVLLIDADIRRPSVHKVFRLGNQEGLVTYLRDQRDWPGLVQLNLAPNLDVLTAGRVTGHPTDLLSRRRLEQLMTEAMVRYDIVLLDAPALFINAPDARILASVVDGACVVVRSGTTSRDALRRALMQVPNLAGLVLNDLHIDQLPKYYRSYFAATADETTSD